MKIKYELVGFDKNKTLRSYGLEPNGASHLYMAKRCEQRMRKYVPKREGVLSTHTTVKPGSVTYEEHYAKPQYYGHTKGTVRHYTTPGTGRYWDRKMKSAEGDMLVREVEAFTKKLKG